MPPSLTPELSPWKAHCRRDLSPTSSALTLRHIPLPMKVNASQEPDSFGSKMISKRGRQKDHHEFEGSLGHISELQASLGCTVKSCFRKMKQRRGKKKKKKKQMGMA